MAIESMTILAFWMKPWFVGVLTWISFFEAGKLTKLESEVHTA